MTASVKQGLQGTDSNSQESGPRRASADYNWLNHDLQCSLIVCSFVCVSVHSVYVVTPQPTPCSPLRIHQIDINIHEEAGGRHPKMRVLMNEANVHVGVYTCVCVCVYFTDAGGQTVIKSQPPPHLHPHQPPVALPPYTVMLTCDVTCLLVVRRRRTLCVE